jgi:hypothetical protein
VNRGILPAVTKGQTLGRMAAGLRLIRTDGSAAGFRTAMWRDVFARILTFIPLVFLLDSLLTTSTDRRSLLDRIAGTLVVTTPAAAGRSRTLVALATVLTVAWIGAWAALADWDTSDDTYSSFDRDLFLSGCTEDGTSESLCACAFDRIKATIPYRTYVELDRRPDPDDWPPDARRAIADAYTACD